MLHFDDDDVESLVLHEHAGIAVHRVCLERCKDKPVISATWLARGLDGSARKTRGRKECLADLCLV